MFDSLSIQNFRGFENLKIAPLQRVNLIAGENNVGKTNVLEAIYLLFSDGERMRQLPATFRSHQQDQNDRENFWLWLFSNHDYDARIRISAFMGDRVELSLSIDLAQENPRNGLVPDPLPKSPAPVEQRMFYFTYAYRANAFRQYRSRNPSQGLGQAHSGGPGPGLSPSVAVFSTSPSNPGKDAVEYNRIVLRHGGEEQMEDLLRIVEPRLKKLRSLQVGSQPVLYADIGLKKLIPVTQLGQGFNRLLTVFSTMLLSDAKILLVDEIENGLHYGAQRAVWKGLAGAARKADIQVFATTHSWGCIVAAHEAFAESEQYDFALHRIQRVKGNIESVTYDREMLEASLETELEVR